MSELEEDFIKDTDELERKIISRICQHKEALKFIEEKWENFDCGYRSVAYFAFGELAIELHTERHKQYGASETLLNWVPLTSRYVREYLNPLLCDLLNNKISNEFPKQASESRAQEVKLGKKY